MTEPEFMAKKRSRGNPRLMSELPRYKAGVSGRKQEIWRSRTADSGNLGGPLMTLKEAPFQ